MPEPASDAIPPHEFVAAPHAPISCRICGEEHRFHVAPASDAIPARSFRTETFLAQCTRRQQACSHGMAHSVERCVICVCEEGEQQAAALTEARATIQRLEAERTKQFPIQRERGAKPHPTHIPWSVAEKAFSVYSARGHSQSLERLAERGGFGPSEMDEYLPGWRDEVNALTQLEARLRTQQAALEQFVMHKEGCAAWFSRAEWRMGDVRLCNCGLAAALQPRSPPRDESPRR